MKLKNDYPLKILKSINLIQDGLYGEMYLEYDHVIKCIIMYIQFLYDLYQHQLLFKSIISICVHISVVGMCV